MPDEFGAPLEGNHGAEGGKSAAGTGVIRVLLADDHTLMRSGLRLILARYPDIEVVAEAHDGDAALARVRDSRPEVVIMDMAMPKLSGLQAAERIRVAAPHVKVLVLSAYQDELRIRQAIRHGASGYMLKTAAADELAQAIRTVHGGGTYFDSFVAAKIKSWQEQGTGADPHLGLSIREREVLDLAVWGFTNAEIAAALHLSIKTVEGHKSRMMEKLNIRTRADLVQYAVARDWLRHDRSSNEG